MGYSGLLAGQPNQQGELVFDAPWQAKTFAMAVQLNQAGLFEWTEWADLLSQNIARFETTSKIQNSDDYYGLWQSTLEQIVNQKTSE